MYLREMGAGRVPVKSAETVEAFARSWLDALPAEGLEGSTVRSYGQAIARVVDVIGDMPLQQVGPLDLDRAYSAMLDAGLSARSVRASHVAAKKMGAEAVRVGKRGTNPAEGARPPSAKAAKAKGFQVWTVDQLDRFLDAVSDTEHAAMWTVLGYTGLRLGEACGLTWEDVDLGRATITVRRSIGRGVDGEYVKEPKTGNGLRVVELDEELVRVLRGHRKAQSERQLLMGSGWQNHEERVFTEPDGRPVRVDRASPRWSDLVRKVAPGLGLPVIRCHDLRHSHCTQMLDAGTRADIVSERLGHASVAFTLSVYAHRQAGDQRSGLARLRAMS